MAQNYTHEVISENEYLPVHFQLVECGPTTIPAHWHDYVELIYFFHGNMTAVIQAETYKMLSGQLLIINTKQLHMTHTYGNSRYILLQIPSQQLHRFFPDFDLLQFQTLISSGPADPRAQTITAELMHMMRLYQVQGDGYQLLFISHLYRMLYQLYKYYTVQERFEYPGAQIRDFQRVTRTLNWVYQNFRDSLTLEDAAAALNISKEYFCRLFKKCTGQTFLEYVNTVRTMNLYDDLKKTDAKITLLMEQNGISNYKVFMRTFKKLYGDTPQNIRRKEAERIGAN